MPSLHLKFNNKRTQGMSKTDIAGLKITKVCVGMRQT